MCVCVCVACVYFMVVDTCARVANKQNKKRHKFKARCKNSVLNLFVGSISLRNSLKFIPFGYCSIGQSERGREGGRGPDR